MIDPKALTAGCTAFLVPSRFEVSVRPAKDGVRLSYWEWFVVPEGEAAEKYFTAAKNAISLLLATAKMFPGLRIDQSGCSVSKNGNILAGFELHTTRENVLAMLLGEVASQLAAETSWDHIVYMTRIMRSSMKDAPFVRPGEKLLPSEP